jgi:hypothetical protein
MTTPIKDDFKVVDIPKMDYKGKVLCNRCGREFHSDELVYGHPLKGFRNKYPSWYCPTWNCQGYLNSGVSFVMDLVKHKD